MSFDDLGWQVFAPEPEVSDWVDHVRGPALNAANDPNLHGDWLRCGGTWFVGVDALPNDADGRVAGGPSLTGKAVDFVNTINGKLPFHKAQVSVIYPGYPKPMPSETEAAFRFRRDRDAAHVDGLLPMGPAKLRFLQEPHAYVLGIPLDDCPASPLVVWDGSHKVMHRAFRDALANIPLEAWCNEDLTEIYQNARRTCFETCQRREIRVPLGGAYVVHRLALHGVAPWDETVDHAHRAIAYLRPQLPDIADWLA